MYHLSLETSREQILMAENFAELRLLRDQVHEMMQVQPLLSNPIQWHLQLNDMHDWLIQRCITLSEKMMEAEGYGSPPVPYVFVLFGSGGRKEQTLWSDQDNGLIYELTEFQDAEKVSAYFAALTRCIVESLMVLGYPPCEGEVICSNHSWRKSIIEWKQVVQGWLDEPNWEHIRYLLIIEDMRAVYGETWLTVELKKFLALYIRENGLVLESLLKNTLHRKASLGFFGQLLTERYGEDAGGVDIKYGSYIPIVNGIRLLAIHAGIMESSTLERIEKLLEFKMVSHDQAEDWKRALALNLALRSVTPFQVEEGMYSSRGKLSVKLLSKKSRQELKFALHVGIELQKYVQRIVQDEITGKRRW
jgi:CBS domain-containing protein